MLHTLSYYPTDHMRQEKDPSKLIFHLLQLTIWGKQTKTKLPETWRQGEHRGSSAALIGGRSQAWHCWNWRETC